MHLTPLTSSSWSIASKVCSQSRYVRNYFSPDASAISMSLRAMNSGWTVDFLVRNPYCFSYTRWSNATINLFLKSAAWILCGLVAAQLVCNYLGLQHYHFWIWLLPTVLEDIGIALSFLHWLIAWSTIAMLSSSIILKRSALISSGPGASFFLICFRTCFNSSSLNHWIIQRRKGTI